MRILSGDLRLAFRVIRRTPGFHLLVVGILAFGIALSVAVFSLVDGVLLRPLPYPQSAGLVAVTTVPAKPPFESNGSFPYSDFEQFRTRSRSFQEIAAFYRSGWGQVTVDDSSGNERLRGGFVTPEFFAMMGRPPLLGRTFTAEENSRRERVLLIAEPLAARRFGSAAAALGRELSVAGARWKIIGIMPADYRVPFLDTQVWAPIQSHPQWFDASEPDAKSNAPRWDIIARLHPGVRVSAAQDEIEAIYTHLGAQNDRAVVVPLREYFTGAAARPLALLSAAVALLLLIALANAGNLVLARAAVRQRDYAIRTAMGAGASRLIRQALTETLLLGSLAGVVGAALSHPVVRILRSAAPAQTPRLDEVAIDMRVLLFAVFISVACGACLGLAAAWRGSHVASGALRSAGRGFTPARETRALKNTLVAFEFALAMILLTATSLLVRSFIAVKNVDVGFHADHLLTMRIDSPLPQERLASLYAEMLARVRRVPGVWAAGLTNSIFQTGITRTHALREVEGRPPEPTETWGMLEWSRISGDYFQAAGIPLLRGRYFNDHDTADTAPVVMINETAARRYWPGEDPIGKRLKGMDPRGRHGGKDDEWITVVGVVRDIRGAGRERQPISQIYEVQAQRGEATGTLVVRTASDPARLTPLVRSAIGGLDARIADIATMQQLLDDQQSQRIFETWLLGVFSAAALGLAALGIFAVMHFSVAARTREIGIRMALGARGSNILALITGSGARLAAAGIAAGAVISAWTGEALSAMLFGISPSDALSLFGSALLLIAVALGACWLPAHRAAHLDPVAALREE